MYVNVKFSSKLPVKIGSYIHDKQTIVDNAVLRYMDLTSRIKRGHWRNQQLSELLLVREKSSCLCPMLVIYIMVSYMVQIIP